ncbi:hypothetical protein Tco_1013347 [Tanacetum coccineum]
MDVAVEEKTPVTETRVVDSSLKDKKVNLDQFIADYQIMNMSEENLVKVNDRASLKTGFRVVGRKKKPEFPDETEVDGEEQEKLESTDFFGELIAPFSEKKRSGKPTQLFKFPWDPYGIVVDDRFWLALLGLEDKKEGGPHVRQAILGGGIPIYHANAKKGSVPWTDVDKVYFPLNEPELRWALAELHICTSVIIIYDSMTP